jgi:hypothetical protein
MTECEYCGEEFKPGGLKSHKSAIHPDEAATTTPCHWCGDDIEVYEWQADEQQFCSRDCNRAWNAYLSKGDRSPVYKNGETRSKDFDLIAMAIRRRDGECRLCGRETADSEDRALHVHHITPEGEAEKPHRATNLICLCNGCHRKMEPLSEEQQLKRIGVRSRRKLRLSPDLAEWLETTLTKHRPLYAPPQPQLGVFAAVEKRDT